MNFSLFLAFSYRTSAMIVLNIEGMELYFSRHFDSQSSGSLKLEKLKLENEKPHKNKHQIFII